MGSSAQQRRRLRPRLEALTDVLDISRVPSDKALFELGQSAHDGLGVALEGRLWRKWGGQLGFVACCARCPLTSPANDAFLSLYTHKQPARANIEPFDVGDLVDGTSADETALVHASAADFSHNGCHGSVLVKGSVWSVCVEREKEKDGEGERFPPPQSGANAAACRSVHATY